MAACTVFQELKHCSVCTEIARSKNTTKETDMTATTVAPQKLPITPTADREYVTATKTVEVQEAVYSLKLNAVQAGYLRDVLTSHIGGEVAAYLRPIATALGSAGVTREYATNNNKKNSVYDDGYPGQKAIVDFSDDYDRELAGVAKKAKF